MHRRSAGGILCLPLMRQEERMMDLILEKKMESAEAANKWWDKSVQEASEAKWSTDRVGDGEIITVGTDRTGQHENIMLLSVNDDWVKVEYSGRRAALHSNPVFQRVLRAAEVWDYDHQPGSGWEVTQYSTTDKRLEWYEVSGTGGGWLMRYMPRQRLQDELASLEGQAAILRQELERRTAGRRYTPDKTLYGTPDAGRCEHCGQHYAAHKLGLLDCIF